MSLQSALMILLLVSLTACTGAPDDPQLPLSAGPYKADAPAADTPAVEERAGTLVLPAAIGKGELIVRVSAAYPWRRVAHAIRASASTNDHMISIAVRDAAGSRRYVRLPAYSRFTEPINDVDGVDLDDNEHVIYLLKDAAGATVREHLGATIAPNELGRSITRVYDRIGYLFFPADETPTKRDFPVWIHAGADVTVQDVIETISLVQTAGFPTVLLQFD